MKILKLLFVLLFGIFVITSCDDEVNTIDNTDKLDCIEFTKDELATVGTLHNQ